MAALPEPIHATVAQIYAARERASDSGHRPHLGASLIGRKCQRRLWYTFRWARAEQFSGRLLRLFERGQLEEARWWRDLRSIGVEVHDAQPDGTQWRVAAIGGHFGGSMDAVVIGIPEAPKSWHVAECKTHNAKSFADLVKNGVMKAKPEHYAQMMIYMSLTGIERAVYLATNKDTDDLYTERVGYNEAVATELMERAKDIITSPEPLKRISNDPSWYECKMCHMAPMCHGTDLPEVNCRTCAHSTPETHGENGVWTCARHGGQEIPLDFQRAGCGEHRYIPIFLQKMGSQVDVRDGNEILYHDDTGALFINGNSPGALMSAELRALEDKAGAAMACAAKLDLAKSGMDARVVA